MSDLPIDIKSIRQDFPILDQITLNNKKLVYLDSSATSQKPIQVINVMDQYYELYNANIHRGIHELAEKATSTYENARQRIAKFIGAKKSKEVIFTRNTTEAINLVAFSWARKNLSPGDHIILTEMEHHSNLVPWQILAEDLGLILDFISVNQDGYLDLSTYDTLLKFKPKLVSLTQLSNVLGTINPVKDIIQKAHNVSAITLIDGAQSVPHMPVNVSDLDVDFLAFSGHKMCGPTGIGVLYGKQEILENMPPFLGGGDMIKTVKLRSFTENELPHKFEAGTPAIAEVIGLGQAVDYLTNIGMQNIERYEADLMKYALDRLSEVTCLRVLGPLDDNRAGAISFVIDDIHPHDIAQILDAEGVAVRAGHHCAMPIHEKFGVNATTRASLYFYNNKEDIDRLIDGIEKVKEIFS